MTSYSTLTMNKNMLRNTSKENKFFCGNEDKKQKKTRNGNKQYFKSDPFVLLPPLIGESKPYKIYLKFTVLKILKKCFS